MFPSVDKSFIMTIVDLFSRMGEQEGIRTLVDTFYDFMAELPEAQVILELHPDNLTESRQKLYEFLVGWSGGPQLYQEKYGHPRLRMRHAPFPIGDDERDQWMLCMRKALKKSNFDEEITLFLEQRFLHIADFMKNV